MALGPEVQPPSAGVGVAKGWAGGLAEVARRETGADAVELDMRASGGRSGAVSSSATFDASRRSPSCRLVVPR